MPRTRSTPRHFLGRGLEAPKSGRGERGVTGRREGPRHRREGFGGDSYVRDNFFFLEKSRSVHGSRRGDGRTGSSAGVDAGVNGSENGHVRGRRGRRRVHWLFTFPPDPSLFLSLVAGCVGLRAWAPEERPGHDPGTILVEALGFNSVLLTRLPPRSPCPESSLPARAAVKATPTPTPDGAARAGRRRARAGEVRSEAGVAEPRPRVRCRGGVSAGVGASGARLGPKRPPVSRRGKRSGPP